MLINNVIIDKSRYKMVFIINDQEKYLYIVLFIFYHAKWEIKMNHFTSSSSISPKFELLMHETV